MEISIVIIFKANIIKTYLPKFYYMFYFCPTRMYAILSSLLIYLMHVSVCVCMCLFVNIYTCVYLCIIYVHIYICICMCLVWVSLCVWWYWFIGITLRVFFLIALETEICTDMFLYFNCLLYLTFHKYKYICRINFIRHFKIYLNIQYYMFVQIFSPQLKFPVTSGSTCWE